MTDEQEARADLMRLFSDPIRDLELLAGLLEHDPGPFSRLESGDIRLYRRQSLDIDAELADALWRFRRYELVEWGERHYYDGSSPNRWSGPLPILTAAGRRLALSVIGAA